MRTTGSTRSSRRLAGVLLLVATAVAGCTARVGPSSAVTGSPPTAHVESLTGNARLSAAATDAKPLDQAALTDQYNRDMMAFMSRCMAEIGFEYTPIELPSSAPHLNGRRLTEADFAEQLGYGIAADIDGGLATRLFPDEPVEDPNIERRAAMSKREGQAYDAALDECIARVGDEIPRPPGSIIEPPGTEDEFEQLNGRIDADPRVVVATRAWSECMAEHGFAYDSQVEIVLDIVAQVAPLKRAYESRGGRFISAAADVESAVNDILAASDRVELASVQAFERSVAVADQECAVDLNKIRTGVLEELVAEILNRAGD